MGCNADVVPQFFGCTNALRNSEYQPYLGIVFYVRSTLAPSALDKVMVRFCRSDPTGPTGSLGGMQMLGKVCKIRRMAKLASIIA